MANNIPHDEEVIGYQPHLEYKKENNIEKNTLQQNPNNEEVNYNGNIKYSKTLTGFKNNAPSVVLKDINFVQNNIRKLVDKLNKAFKDGNWNRFSNISSLVSAFENNNELYIDAFAKYHHDNIEGSIVPELIQLLSQQKIRLETLEYILKELFYGDSSLDLATAISNDNSYIKQLQAYEEAEKNDKINYTAISYDAIFNKNISLALIQTNKKCIDISSIINNNTGNVVDNTKRDLIEKIFHELNNDIDYRQERYSREQSIAIMEKALYNYYMNRKNMLDLQELLRTSSSEYLIHKYQEYKENALESIKNISRNLKGNHEHLKCIYKLEQEKYHLLNIYGQFNYIS